MTEYTVTLVDEDGESWAAFPVEDTETILRAALDAGVPLEYSCRVGMCCACSMYIEEGDVTQPAAHAYTDEQQDEYALTCMARPQSDLQLRRGFPPSIEADGTAANATAASRFTEDDLDSYLEEKE